MKYRPLPRTDLLLSEIGFGLWTVSTGWWGQFTDEEAVALMHKALDLGITLFDAADTYGNGRSEELLAKAFPTPADRDKVVIATKVGYNFYDHGEERRGQREIPHDFSLPFIRQATDLALQRLKTDRIDILQLHNIRMEQVQDDGLWELLAALQKEGKIRSYGAALGPAIGWLYEGIETLRQRRPHILQHIYNLLEPHPGRQMMDDGESPDTRFLVRVPHSSGMLEGKYTAETTFPPTDHRSHRPRSWLLSGIQKVDQLRFLEGPGRTLGQAALQWLLADPRTGCCLPNIYNAEQLEEFAAAPETPALTAEELARIDTLVAANFGLPPEEPRFKGTMTPPLAGAAA
ncbi:MAG: aldo/keto reductase [Verrucomicrobium sp.]|nr:aldo/keto reductase [Verrucomicrobium sp.]